MFSADNLDLSHAFCDGNVGTGFKLTDRTPISYDNDLIEMNFAEVFAYGIGKNYEKTF